MKEILIDFVWFYLLQSDIRIIVDHLAEGKNYIPTDQKIQHLEALLLLFKAVTGDCRYEEILLGAHRSADLLKASEDAEFRAQPFQAFGLA